MATLKSGNNLTTYDFLEGEEGYPVYGGNGFRGYFSHYSNDGDFVLIGRQGALCGNINYATENFGQQTTLLFVIRNVSSFSLGLENHCER